MDIKELEMQAIEADIELRKIEEKEFMKYGKMNIWKKDDRLFDEKDIDNDKM